MMLIVLLPPSSFTAHAVLVREVAHAPLRAWHAVSSHWYSRAQQKLLVHPVDLCGGPIKRRVAEMQLGRTDVSEWALRACLTCTGPSLEGIFFLAMW